MIHYFKLGGVNLKALKRKKKVDWPQVIFIIILVIWALIIAYPFYNSFLVSIVPMQVYLKTPFLIFPTEIDLSSYTYVLQWKSLIWGFRTTIILFVVGSAYNMILTIFTAYALTKPIPGRKFFSYMIIFTMYFSGGLIPGYLLMKNLHLINTYASMILPTGINIMYLILMQSYFRTLPNELEEAARIDGASDIIILFKIILPLSLPMMATIFLFYGVDRWNEWYLGMLYIRDAEKWPLQLFIRNMLQQAALVTSDIPSSARGTVFPLGLQMATIIITILPIACLYPFLQKYFVKGLVLGGVKG